MIPLLEVAGLTKDFAEDGVDLSDQAFRPA